MGAPHLHPAAKRTAGLLMALAMMTSVYGGFVIEEGGLKVRVAGAGVYSDRTFFVSRGSLKHYINLLQITFPPEAKAKYPGGFDMALANFGAPKYGGALM